MQIVHREMKEVPLWEVAMLTRLYVDNDKALANFARKPVRPSPF